MGRGDPGAADPHRQGSLELGRSILLAYAGVLIWLSPLALQDYPNHLARVFVLSDLIFHHGAHFGEQFQYRFLAIPYILGDLLLAGAVALFGIGGAAALWTTVVFLSAVRAALLSAHDAAGQ